ncbi:MAG: glycosyltransferase family 9 protein [Muribaculaceae bacterium]|nr:glycosyltransferase family 9 protein [Muribaculaceae bacterium]
MAKNKVTTQKTVLITRFSALGDVAMTIPIVYPVCEANPEVKFIFVTRKEAAAMFINTPENLIVLGIDLDQYKGLTGPLKLARNLHFRYDFDTMADLHDVLRTKFMRFVLKHKGVTVAHIDKGHKEKRKLISGKLRQQLTSTHDRYKAVFSQLGLTGHKEFSSIFEDTDIPDSPMVPAKEDGTKWIAISPFSQHHGKEYPLEKIEQVINELTRKENYYIFLMGGGEKERKALNPLKNLSHVVSLPHIKHSFADELALLAHCDVMVTMDSANMHLASLVGLPVVSVWGATHPWCGFMGWHQSLDNAVQLDLDCRPCSVFGNKKCRFGDYHCMNDITPQMIIDKVTNILEQ